MSKKVLIVAPVTCYPAYSGNSARIAAIYELLVAKGLYVYYLHLPTSPSDPEEMVNKLKEKYFYRKYHTLTSSKIKLVFKALKAILLRQKSRKVKIDDFLVDSDIGFYKDVVEKVAPDIVWINYVFYSKLFNYTPPGILKILDTHDSVYLRFNKIFNNTSGYRHIEFTIADEIKCIDRADHIVCIQSSEEVFFEENCSTKKISTVGHIHPFVPTTIRTEKNKLLFLANDHFTYKDAITYFIKQVWPLLKAENPGIQLFIAGRICRRLNKELLDDNITVLGVVPDLKTLYDSIDITINPIASGSGLKIKNIESLCFGKPVVTSFSGKEGLEAFEQKGLVIANDTEDWVNQIITLLNDKNRYKNQISDLKRSINDYNDINLTEFDKLFNNTTPLK